MKLITSKEIINLYKKVGLDPAKQYAIRHTINTGTLNNQLVTDLNRGSLYQYSKPVPPVYPTDITITRS